MPVRLKMSAVEPVPSAVISPVPFAASVLPATDDENEALVPDNGPVKVPPAIGNTKSLVVSVVPESVLKVDADVPFDVKASVAAESDPAESALVTAADADVICPVNEAEVAETLPRKAPFPLELIEKSKVLPDEPTL